MNPPPTTISSPKIPWLFILRGLIAAALVGYIVHRSGPSQVWQSLEEIDPTYLIQAMALYAVLQLLSACKWGLILRSLAGDGSGKPAPYTQLAMFYYMGMFTNLFFPSSIGGDTLRTITVAPYAGGVARGALSILMERTTGFLAVVIIGLVGGILLAGQPAAWRYDPGDVMFQAGITLLVAGAGACLVFFGATICFRRMILADRVPRWTPKRLQALLRKLAESLENLEGNSNQLLGIIALSFVFQVSYVTLNQLMMAAAGIHLSFLYLCYFSPLLAIVSFVPLTPNAFGVRELTVTAMLASQGVPNHQAVTFCIVNYVVMTVVSFPGALALLLLRTDLRSLAKRKEVEGYGEAGEASHTA